MSYVVDPWLWLWTRAGVTWPNLPVLLAVASLVWLLCYGFKVWDRLRLRHIPPVPWTWRHFLLGHLADFLQHEPFECYQDWQQKLGGVFLVFLGRNPVVVLSDPELIRSVGVSKFKQFHDHPPFISIPNSRNKRIQAVQSGLLVAKGAYWASLRAALQPLFHTSALNSYGPIVTQAAAKLGDKLQPACENGQSLELHSMLGAMTMSVIGQAAFGIDFTTDRASEDQAAGIPNVGAAVKTIFERNRLFSAGGLGGVLLRVMPLWMEPLVFLAFFVYGGWVGQGLEYARTTLMATADLLLGNALRRAEKEGRRVAMRQTDWQWWSKDSLFVTRNPFQDVTPARSSVIELLMAATNKETGAGLSDMQIAANCNTVIAAGYETSANSLSFTIYLLAGHPEIQARVAAEVDAFGRDKVPSCGDMASFPYIEAVVQESLRLFPPAYISTREANEDSIVGGYLIPKGTQVHFNIYGLHRDPAYWRQPEAFRPERFLDRVECEARNPHAYIPFGLGPRMCIGWRFAMNEMVLALVRLYQRYTFELAPGQSKPPKLRAGITLAPEEGIWLRVHSRA